MLNIFRGEQRIERSSEAASFIARQQKATSKTSSSSRQMA
jgi:hypothetical protein